MLAAEHKELPAEVQAEVINFAEMNIRWLVRVLFLDKKVRLGVEAIQSRARAIYAAILGAQLAGRSRDDASIYDEIVKTYRTAGLIP
jgi:TetR/AcrR family transcriptional repressor of nem operon